MTVCRKQNRRKASAQTYFDATGVRFERRLQPDRRQIDALQFMGLFAGVPPHLAESLMQRCTVAEYNSGDLVLSPGQQNDSIRVLLSGRLKVRLGDTPSNDFIIINPGECIGEMSIIDGKPVSAYVVAETVCRMLVIPQHEFWSSLSSIPGLARNLMATLAERMRAGNQAVLRRLRAQMELEHIQKELAIAGDIQASLLPSEHPLFPGRDDFDLFFLMHPAKNVGGDFYDAFLVAPNKLFVAVGDVSGKGIAAALFMVQSITHLKTQALSGFPPDEILTRVNNSLCANNTAAMFVTLFCGILDTETGEFVYSNGGHNPPLTDALTGNFEFMPIPQGIVVGFMEDVQYSSASLRLKPGDAVFVYSDGVTEAEDRHKNLFSDEKLAELLADSGKLSPRETIERVRNEIHRFSDGADQSDDITMLSIRYLGK